MSIPLVSDTEPYYYRKINWIEIGILVKFDYIYCIYFKQEGLEKIMSALPIVNYRIFMAYLSLTEKCLLEAEKIL